MHDPWDTRYLRSRLPRGLQPERVHLPFDSIPYTQDDLPSPDPVPVTVQLPPGMIAQQANDLVTRTPVPVYSTKNGRVIVDVAENPVALLAIPAPQ